MELSDIILPHGKSKFKSRSEVDTSITCNNITLSSPVVLSNMETCQNDRVLDIYDQNKWPYVYHRLGGEQDILDFVAKINLENWHLKSISVGVSEKDRFLLTRIKNSTFDLDWITIDVALIYNEHFEEYIKWVRKEFPGVYLIAGNFTGSECANWLHNMGVDCGKTGIGKSKLCFEGETVVKTKNGKKKIKDVLEGDIVLTHEKKWKKVSRTFKKYSKDLIRVNGVTCTKDHKFYVIEKKNKNLANENNLKDYAFWIEAVKITKNHLIVAIE
jgi:hypothetical protein